METSSLAVLKRKDSKIPLHLLLCSPRLVVRSSLEQNDHIEMQQSGTEACAALFINHLFMWIWMFSYSRASLKVLLFFMVIWVAFISWGVLGIVPASDGDLLFMGIGWAKHDRLEFWKKKRKNWKMDLMSDSIEHSLKSKSTLCVLCKNEVRVLRMAWWIFITNWQDFWDLCAFVCANEISWDCFKGGPFRKLVSGFLFQDVGRILTMLSYF